MANGCMRLWTATGLLVGDALTEVLGASVGRYVAGWIWCIFRRNLSRP